MGYVYNHDGSRKMRVYDRLVEGAFPPLDPRHDDTTTQASTLLPHRSMSIQMPSLAAGILPYFPDLISETTKGEHEKIRRGWTRVSRDQV